MATWRGISHLTCVCQNLQQRKHLEMVQGSGLRMPMVTVSFTWTAPDAGTRCHCIAALGAAGAPEMACALALHFAMIA